MAQQGQSHEMVKGVVWEVPGDYRTAASDLIEMRSVGIEAVRTGLIFDRGLLELADSLDLVLYREIPFFGLSARSVQDSVVVVDSLVQQLLVTGKGLRSAGPIGLARYSDTTVPSLCPSLREWTSQIRAAGGTSYYITDFIEKDACSDEVDFVLLDALDEKSPSVFVTRWREAHASPVGLARIGTHVVSDELFGTRIEGSPEYQARFLENALTELKDVLPTYVFVHRWKDARLGLSPEAGDAVTAMPPDPYHRQYGLYSAGEEPRPALYVVRGFFMGTQTVFAFEGGEPAEQPLNWFTLVGWILLSMVAVMYAASPRFRSMIPRYFFSHGFYRNAVREAREVLPLTSTAILTITGLSIGMIATSVLTNLRLSKVALHLFTLLDESSRTALIPLLDAPFVLTVLTGSAALLSMAIWMGLWMAVSGRRTTLYPSQALMLAVWPRWQVLFILPLAMTFEAVGFIPLWVTAAMGLVWVVAAYWSTLRTTFDMSKVAKISPGASAVIWFFNPLILGTLGVLVWMLFRRDEIAFVWHLISRS